jgi:hypothetical protein
MCSFIKKLQCKLNMFILVLSIITLSKPTLANTDSLSPQSGNFGSSANPNVALTANANPGRPNQAPSSPVGAGGNTAAAMPAQGGGQPLAPPIPGTEGLAQQQAAGANCSTACIERECALVKADARGVCRRLLSTTDGTNCITHLEKFDTECHSQLQDLCVQKCRRQTNGNDNPQQVGNITGTR